MESIRPEFRVLVIPRSARTFAFATLGMSAPEDSAALEVHILTKRVLSATARDSIVEILAAVAHFHRNGHPLNLAHTVDFGRPWVPDSSCSCGVLSLPYLDGPKLEWMEHPRVRFLWLVPITVAERDFKKVHGLEALEQIFEQKQVDLLDPKRPSVV
jgi:hypothetical protein